MNYINKGKRDILLFPDFSNIQKIENVRKKYDELYGINTNYIFLNLVKGKKEIIHIHKIIYEKVLNKSLNLK